MEQRKIDQMATYLQTMQIPEDETRSLQKFLIRESPNFTLYKDTLYRYNTENGTIRKILNKQEAQEMMNAYHQHPLGGHLAYNNTLQWVKKLHQRNSVFLKYKYSSVSLTFQGQMRSIDLKSTQKKEEVGWCSFLTFKMKSIYPSLEMHKKLPTDIQNSIKVLLENSDDPAVIGKRVGVHRNTVNRYANKWMHDGILEIYAETKKKKPLLTEKHKKARLGWAKRHQY
ncbi:hypothetical protein RO3G_12653 [Rhizopus delemar RA 99-880]|uniref:Transposase Tc1-like domain-containing protein n=1 Tax=Rhizopus delemar (strain RA 99-880 / ATCC MYA-4621 / FGSC 9543 / NRRL 43880) TaxID=246409 RepID=I1CHL2_RHIO9|nr:hypothetical protein RO3G_12653 [Rhizopus delemar RA 99-880]|eukprot:EIE87942.1 hypothetical protein RO3G_12653 [Rhizopus delemar RA 99-880]